VVERRQKKDGKLGEISEVPEWMSTKNSTRSGNSSSIGKSCETKKRKDNKGVTSWDGGGLGVSPVC